MGKLLYAFFNFFLSVTVGTLLTRPTLCGGDVIEVDVLILGAGISGIGSGNHLQNSNITNFLVLEAQDYIGGRVKQFYIGNVTVGEGANWVHYVEDGDENPMLGFANKLKLARYLNNNSDFSLRNSDHDNADFYKTWKTWEKIDKAIIAQIEKNLRKGDQPLSSFLAQNDWLPDTPLKRTAEWYLDYEFAVRPAMISTRQYAGIPKKNEYIIDRRGFKGIIDYLAQNITGKIKMNKVVTQIKYDSSGIEVRTKDGDTYKAKYGLCTFSTGVLASDLVKFVPELPKWKKEAISRLPLAYYTNIYVKFPTVFWEDNEFIFNAGSITETFPLVYNLNKKGLHPGSNILLFSAVEDNSLRIEAQSKNETIVEVMKTLRKMYPNINIPQPTEIYVGQMSQNPYIRGSFSNAVVGTTSADFHNLEGRVGDLFFAGEAMDEDYWGYTQGAYAIGLKQVEIILSCLSGKKCPEYTPEDADVQCPTNNNTVPTVPCAGNVKRFSFVSWFFLVIAYAMIN